MGTPFTNIYDLAMVTIRDYRLDNLAKTDIKAFYLVLNGYLVNAIADSSDCLVDLSYDLETASLNIDVPFRVQTILANFLIYRWFTSLVNDITQVNLKLQGRDKKTFAESQNLKEKAVYVNDLYKKTNQMCVDYQKTNLISIFEKVNE